MVGLIAIPGALQVLGLLGMPKSPRWLAARGHVEEAKEVLRKMRQDGEKQNEEMEEIIAATKDKKTGGAVENLIRVARTGHVRKALVLGSGVLFFQQFCGIDGVVFYSGHLFKTAGFTVDTAVWLVNVPNAINFLASIVGLVAVERWGRRPVLMLSLAGNLNI
ncbi:proton myo-inositol cotransporter [Elysia marginata]|uniref:Proton myo-inositol cotransporter n=1 Tax=Elysia marginata TaxID=1093978 RepID=A0AAV4FLX2_9GAST|nr:proton myo-inositol cotransporter [Elysia marginata]